MSQRCPFYSIANGDNGSPPSIIEHSAFPHKVQLLILTFLRQCDSYSLPLAAHIKGNELI